MYVVPPPAGAASAGACSNVEARGGGGSATAGSCSRPATSSPRRSASTARPGTSASRATRRTTHVRSVCASKSASHRSSSAASASRLRLCSASTSTSDQSSASRCSSSATSVSRAAISASIRSSSLGRSLRFGAGLTCFGFGFGSGRRSGRARGPLLAAAEHLRPAAVVRVELAVLDRERPLGDRVEQRAVVRDEQHGAGERLERGLERFAALEVEVVRRLVEHEEVRAGGDRHREREPAPLSAREHRHVLLVLVPAGEEEAPEQRLRVGPVQPGHRLRRTGAPSRAVSSSSSCCEK